MKKISILALFSASLFLSACGCFGLEEKEDPAQVRVEDSLAEIDRNESVDEADRMLREADSLEQVKQDSIAKAQSQKK